MSVGGSTATRRWSLPPNSSRGTPPRGWGQANRTRRASETTRRFASTVYSVPSGPRAACTIPVTTVSTRPLPRSSDSTSFLSVITNRNSDSGSRPITSATAGSFPWIALGISTRSGRRYARGVPPRAATRTATPAVRAPPVAERVTDCGVFDWDDGSTGARDRQPPSATLTLADRARLPREPHVVEARPLDGGKPHREESQNHTTSEREP